jgi:hypothetical protein
LPKAKQGEKLADSIVADLRNRLVEEDIKEGFITYMTTVWGLLAGLTAVFPTADVILKVIPLPVDAYEKSTAPIAIPITTLVGLYIVFYSFVRRDRVTPELSWQASLVFILGLISLVVFFLLDHFEYALRTRLFPSLDSGDDYVLMLVAIVPFYVIFFALVTRGFAILALIEFQRRSKGLPEPGSS